jgi:hypothetical protein
MFMKITKKSVILTFDGFSEFYGAHVQGAFCGKFIVPLKHRALVEQATLDDLLEMHSSGRFGIVLKNQYFVQ